MGEARLKQIAQKLLDNVYDSEGAEAVENKAETIGLSVEELNEFGYRENGHRINDQCRYCPFRF